MVRYPAPASRTASAWNLFRVQVGCFRLGPTMKWPNPATSGFGRKRVPSTRLGRVRTTVNYLAAGVVEVGPGLLGAVEAWPGLRGDVVLPSFFESVACLACFTCLTRWATCR